MVKTKLECFETDCVNHCKEHKNGCRASKIELIESLDCNVFKCKTYAKK